MSKIVSEGITNTYRSLLRWMWVWDKKFFKDFFPSLLKHKTSVLMKLSLNDDKNRKEIWIRNSSFLAKESFAWFPLKVEKRCFSLLWEIKEEDYICMDEVDIAKPSAKLMEWIYKIHDSSRKEVVNGYLFHGVSIRGIPVIMQQEDIENNFKSSYFWDIITRLLQYTKKKGTILLDAGYDGKAYMSFLLEKWAHFIVRAKRERILYNKLGEQIWKMKSFKEWVYKVYLKQDNGDLNEIYLYVKQFPGYSHPMRIYSDTDNRDVLEYKKRWDIECIFKTMKQEYKMEKIWVSSLQVLQNIVATIQMAVAFSHSMYGIQIEHKWRKFFQCGLALKNRFKKYAKWQGYTMNRNSYIWFISYVIQWMYKYRKKRRKTPLTSNVKLIPQLCLF
jgi:hypothetical protein